jgi:hypothetical protein
MSYVPSTTHFHVQSAPVLSLTPQLTSLTSWSYNFSQTDMKYSPSNRYCSGVKWSAPENHLSWHMQSISLQFGQGLGNSYSCTGDLRVY